MFEHFVETSYLELNTILAGNYMFKVNKRNTRTRCKICSKLTRETLEQGVKYVAAFLGI